MLPSDDQSGNRKLNGNPISDFFGYGRIWGWVKTYDRITVCHILGNNHPLTKSFRVPRFFMGGLMAISIIAFKHEALEPNMDT